MEWMALSCRHSTAAWDQTALVSSLCAVMCEAEEQVPQASVWYRVGAGTEANPLTRGGPREVSSQLPWN